MIELGAATTDQMVLCFLKAEIDSHRQSKYMLALKAYLPDRSLIDNADLSDPEANRSRAMILGAVRGYGHGVYLFEGSPSDVKWRRVSIAPDDFGRIKYLSIAWAASGSRARANYSVVHLTPDDQSSG